MILYLDTSALVNPYVREASSDAVLSVMTAAQAVASHIIAFVEAHAALARLGREGALSEEALTTVKQEFVVDWPHYLQMGMTQPLLQRAADLVEAFALGAYDSVHLAAADYFYHQGSEEKQLLDAMLLAVPR